jgi:hypothetical protein
MPNGSVSQVNYCPWLAQLLIVAFIVTATFFSRTKPLSLEARPEFAEATPYSTTSTRVTISWRGSSAGQ